jgi:hypothetical protein
MLRDPVTRIASQVRHGLYDGWGRSLDEGITDDLIDFSRYAMQADRYAEHFPPESMLLLPVEELQADPAGSLRRTCEFLGVTPDHSFENTEERRNTGDFYTVNPLVAGAARNRAAKWVLDRVLTRGARHALRNWLARSTKSEGAAKALGRWQLNEAEETEVRARLADDMSRLRDHYGVRAPWLPAGP